MATKRHCCIRFCCSCFSLPNEKEHDHTSAGAQTAPSDEKGDDPTPAGAQSAPSEEKAHDPTPAGAQSAPSDEKGHDPTSAGARSSPSAIDSTIENLPGAPKRTEAPISSSNLNVSGDEAQVSESSNVPLISEGEIVNANQNVSGPPGCNEAPSSSSSSGAIKSALLSSIRHTDIDKVDGKYVVDFDKLIEHISYLFKLREEKKNPHENASIPRNFPWPDVPGLTKLKKILHLGTDLRNLKELLSAGLQFVSDLKDNISGPVKTLLKDIGQVNIATAGLLVVAYTLERFDDLSTNKEKCWDLLKEMCYVATVVKRLKENSEGTHDVIEEATALLVEGAIMCCTQIDSSAWKSFFETSKIKSDLSDIRQKLNVKYMQINIEIGFRVLSAMESKGRSPLSKKYPKHAVGIDDSIQDVLKLLECESEEKAVTVILHGFGGMGKTTLADAVFSKVGGCRYSHVQLFKDIDSKPDITRFCNLSSITHLSMTSSYLEKLPDGFGQLASLKELDFQQCWRLELPEGFGQLRNLEVLFLRRCDKLRELCNDFHCLSSLHTLDLSDCQRLEKLPEDFHCLTSLQRLNLSGCCELEGRSMNHMVKMNRLQVVQIKGSEQLVKRWAEIQRDGDGLCSFTVISGQDLSISESEKENIENNLLSELDGLLTNGQKEPFRVSDLPPNTLILVICAVHFPWSLIEETIDEMQIKCEIIYIGSYFDQLPKKVKDSIFVVDLPETGAYEMLQKVCLTLDAAVPHRENSRTWYLQMHTKMVGEKSDKYRPCWRFLTEGELEEFVVGNSRRYLRLKQLVERNQKSNIKLLRELFARDETTPVFQKNESSRQDPKEKLEQKTACGVDKLEGKTILLEMRPIQSRYSRCKSFYDIRLQSLKAMYEVEKEKLDLEIISIPLVGPGDEYYVFDLYRQFSREVPWFVLQNSWMVKRSMFQGKLICLYTAGKDEKVTRSIWNAMEHFRDSIYIIYMSYSFSKNIGFTKNISKDYSLKIFTENTKEMPFSNLSMHETVRFAMRLDHLEEEINGIDESDKQLCELKSLLHSVHGDLDNGSITFMDERGGMVAAFRGRILKSIFLGDRKDRAQRVIKSMMEDFGGGVKEMHDHDPGVFESLIKSMHTAVEQENMDVYLDSLRNYISELRGVELYQLLNVNKEAKKWSRPKVTWPTSRSFCMLKDFLSEGTHADWVKDVFSRHPEENTKLELVIKSLLSGIEEANWAVAGLLAVADVLERFETVSANQIEESFYQIEGLFILHAMLRLAQKPGLWRNIKRVATALILVCCIVCRALINPSKSDLFELEIDVFPLGTRQFEEGLIKQCDLIAKAITEGLDESGSIIKQMSAGLEDYLETFCEEESDVSFVKVCL